MPRTRAMIAAQAVEHDDNPESHESKPGSESLPRKRARANKKVTRTPERPDAPGLKRVLDMSPEVFNEVATHLMPGDLLSLARSNKFFRKMFMSRSSRHIWQTAFSNIPDIPPCPPSLSEPQYSSLIFSKTCSTCGTKVRRRMDAVLRVRLCDKCLNKEIIPIWEQHVCFGFVPRSGSIKESPMGWSTLRSEFAKIKGHVAEIKGLTISSWKNTRLAEMEEWHEHGYELETYLDKLDSDRREAELEALKKE